MGVTYTDQAPLVPLIQAELGISDTQAGLFPTALFVVSIGVLVVLASHVDRLGARRVNGWGTSLAVAANLAFAVAPTYEWLLVAKGAGGIASALAFLGGVRYIASLYAGSRSHFGQGLYGAGFPLGGALGLQLLPPLALAFAGWRGGMAASTALIAVAAVAWWLWAPDVPAVTQRGGLVRALGSANAWWCFVVHAAGFGLSIAVGSWIAVYILREFGTSLVISGALGSLLLVTAVVMRSVGGWLVSRHVARTVAVMRGSQLLSLAGLGLLAVPQRPLALALFGTILVGVGVSLPYAAVFNTAAASVPRSPAAGQSLAGIGGTLGAVVGAPAMGAAIDGWGFTAAWLAVGALPAVALASTFLMDGEEALHARQSGAEHRERSSVI